MVAEQTETKHLLVGHSPRIRQVHRLVEKLGTSRWPVLLLGETGTGKEVVARSIYGLNPTGPFVTIDCASLVGPLMESELFGYVKGSFTGATSNKLGLIEAANGGTAFFDEIGELPLDLQAKLLRVLQQKEFRPVGSLSQRRSDFRIIAATNRDLLKEVEKGTFRRDLYYRLNVVTLKLAPLRERIEDVPVLAEHFLAKYGNGHTITQEALDVMTAYEWPGNIRELENCIQHMVAMNTGPLLHAADLPTTVLNSQWEQRGAEIMEAAGLPPTAFTGPASHPTMSGPIVPLAEMERQAIMQALAYTKGDRAVAAQMLGIGRTTLYRKLKEYEMAAQAIGGPAAEASLYTAVGR